MNQHEPGMERPLLPLLPPITKRQAVTRLFLYTLLHIAISLVVTFVVTVVFSAASLDDLPGNSLPTGDQANELMRLVDELVSEHLGTITFISLIVSSALSILVYHLFIRRQQRAYAPLSAKTPARWTVLPFAVVGTIAACLLVSMFLAWLMELLPEGTQTSSLDNLTAHPVLVILGVVILGPIAEEFLFRTLCLRNLNSVFPFRVANVMQALLFGLTHMVPLQVAYAFVFGLLLGWLYDRTGRILVPIVAHMAFNFIGALALIFPQESLESVETSAALDPLITAITLAVTILALWRVAVMTRKNTNPWSSGD